MKHSLKDGGGYLSIDHRDSPGLTPADVAGVPGMVAVGKGEHFETDVYQCGHCSRTVMLQAITRPMSDRGVCLKCYKFICEACRKILHATNTCTPIERLFDRELEKAVKFANQPDHPDAAGSIEPDPPTPRIVLTDL